MHTIYTFGYGGQQPGTLYRHLEATHALLIDVRAHAWSRAPQWRPDALKRLVGAANYLHLPQLGNVNYRTGGPIQLVNPEAAVPIVAEHLTQRPVILLCGCATVQTCHRREAAFFLGRACGAPVELSLPPLAPKEREWKVLTLTQPWASLVACGAKTIETRSWTTRYRGKLLIHAAKGLAGLTERAYRDLCQTEPFIETLTAGGFAAPADLPRGAIVAVCNLADVQRIDIFNLPDEPERSFGHYAADRYAWQLANVIRLPDPIPASGAQGLWTWTGNLEVPRCG
jgi:hypothetical protein